MFPGPGIRCEGSQCWVRETREQLALADARDLPGDSPARRRLTMCKEPPGWLSKICYQTQIHSLPTQKGPTQLRTSWWGKEKDLLGNPARPRRIVQPERPVTLAVAPSVFSRKVWGHRELSRSVVNVGSMGSLQQGQPQSPVTRCIW
jgi:hypothetical protein